MSDSSKKTSWPEVEGLPSEVAKHKIVTDRPDVQVVVLPDDSYVSPDFNDKRVRVFFDKDGNVDKVPKIG